MNVFVICFIILEIVVILFSAFEKACFPELSYRVFLLMNQVLPVGGTIFIYISMLFVSEGNVSG
jgi:hypothetical protein